jgi:drug/metabolite transporter (DMT)-like permease
VLLALPAIVLVSTSGATGDGSAAISHAAGDASAATSPSAGRPALAGEVVDGLLAGVGFALLFVGLNLAGDGSGLWPVVASQGSALVLLAIVLVGTLRHLGAMRLPRRDVAGAASVGVLGAAAAVAYFLSTNAGLLSIVVVLTSLYPAVTVLLAAAILHEPIARRQAVGLVLAAGAVLLIVLG